VITLVKEDGTGLADANTYADVDDGDAYHEASLYGSAWSDSQVANHKGMALAMATRVIDGEFQFNGFKVKQAQALQWPRRLCPDPDSDQFEAWMTYGGGYYNPSFGGNYLPENAVPRAVIAATCEMALRLLQTNRVPDPREAAVGAGVKEFELEGALRVEFNTTTASESFVTPIVPRDVENLLAKYGRLLSGGGGTVRLIRS